MDEVPDVPDTPSAEPARHSSSSRDGESRKLIIAVVALVLVAVAAVAFGLARKNSSSNDVVADAAGSKDTVSSTPSDPARSTAAVNLCGTWDSQYIGQSQAQDNAKQDGYFLWVDYTNWHVRARSAAGKVFKGTITSSRPIVSAKALANSFGQLKVVGNTITFEFKGTKDLAGFDFNEGCIWPPTVVLNFNLTTDGQPADPSSIFTGANDTKGLTPSFTAIREIR